LSYARFLGVGCVAEGPWRDLGVTKIAESTPKFIYQLHPWFLTFLSSLVRLK